MREVTLEEILDAREERIKSQREMLQKHKSPLISFCMNIAGPVKNSPLIRKAFDEGTSMLEAALAEEDLRVTERIFKDSVTGCEAIYAVNAPARRIKGVCVSVEEGTELGRLFDMDVIDVNGAKLERESERKCIICGASGKGCASRRIHTVNELQSKTGQMITLHFALAESERISEMATAALVEEVYTTPKPGLVDKNNTGSHTDMDIGTFLKSAEALKHFWKQCFLTGFDTREDAPGYTFETLKHAGIDAEREMFQATGGVNTHKGAIFFMGIICGAIGRLFDATGSCISSAKIADECASMTVHAIGEELSYLKKNPEEAKTAGEKIWVKYGVSGARGEISGGLPMVIDTGLPVLEDLLQKGLSRNDAGAAALIAMIACGPDTNMIKRGGYDAACEVSYRAEKMVEDGSYIDIEAIRELDERFISLGLSPGGCADMLTVTYFLHDYCDMKKD